MEACAMKVAMLLSGSYVGSGKQFPLFMYWENKQAEIDIVSCPFQRGILKKIFVAALQTISFLPSARKYDVVVSMGLINGIIFSTFRTVFGMEKPLHIVFQPMVGRLLSPSRHKLYTSLFRPFFSLLLFRVNGMICTSEWDYQWWKDDLGFGGKVFQIRWGGFEGFEPKFISEQSEQGNYIFSAGREGRDFQTLISAAEGIDVEFIIVAGKDTLTKKTGLEGIKVPKNVRVFIEVPFSQYADLLLKSKIVVVPLKYSSVAIGTTVILQAMSIGKPVIATKLPPLLDYIEDGKTGLFVKPANVQDLREKILFLLEHQEEAQRIGNNAKAEFKFTGKVTSQSIGRIIENVYLQHEQARTLKPFSVGRGAH
jgi:glycosyltransferase involved in cell wall biosynthesis